uniref:Uncharacterized protein n=1 Tax=Meloidogyne javanica TaxID=6303 RepID=A0A915MWZ5_MELJA
QEAIVAKVASNVAIISLTDSLRISLKNIELNKL